MKYFTLLIAALFSLHVYAQNVLTDTEVFDFEVGDLFQYRSWNTVSPDSDLFDLTVLSKTFNVDSTSVTYLFAKSRKNTYQDFNTGTVTHSYFKDTVQFTYPRLSEPIDSFIISSFGGSLDTSYGGDYLFSDDTTISLCYKRLRRLDYLTSRFEGVYYIQEYAAGLGLIYDYLIDGTNPGTGTPEFYTSMRGYIKNGVRCGSILPTSLGEPEFVNRHKVKAYPNPSTGMVHMETTHELEIDVLDLNGTLIFEDLSVVPGEPIDLKTLPDGV
ncbi:MAG: hypothetical protein HWE14_12745, partial [Flavobacteriia bacterium]|nr:hypothetical protein [Flavobacteriia bacterium]